MTKEEESALAKLMSEKPVPVDEILSLIVVLEHRARLEGVRLGFKLGEEASAVEERIRRRN